MKKIFLIISLTILTITAVKSQEKIQFGLKGGINFTSMTSDFLIDKDYQTGFHIGVLAEIPLGDRYSLQPEILYATQGVKGKVILYAIPYPGAPDFIPYPGAPDVLPYPVAYKLNYIQVPVLVKIYLVNNFSLEIGPSFNFLLNDKETFENTTRTDLGKSFEFSGVLGLSYQLKGGLFGGLRFVNGFTAALDRDNYDEEAKNNGFQLGVGFMF
ncbi:MAG: PorT family protein [Flavobacteriaceae bacterium]|nr:PorT family protein [Flavobacteriaceae bacterium]